MRRRAGTADPPFPEDLLTPDEVRDLVRACSARSATGLRNRALITTLYRGGLRVGEALELRPADLDRADHAIAPRRSGGTRRVGLDAGAFELIARWCERRDELRVPDDAPLFCTLTGGPVSPSYVRTMLRRVAGHAGIEKKVSAEALRRSLAIELAREGFSLVAIQRQLGHSAAAVTSRYLARIEGDLDEDALRTRKAWRP